MMVGIAPSSLIVGVLPVTVTLAGSARSRRGAAFRGSCWPLAMVIAASSCINIDVFQPVPPAGGSAMANAFSPNSAASQCAVGALGCWTWFAVVNARYLQRETHFSGNEWSVLWGVVTGILGAALCSWSPRCRPGGPQGGTGRRGSCWHMFWMLNLGLAIGASWLGNGLWNAASQAPAAHAIRTVDRVRNAVRAALRVYLRRTAAAACWRSRQSCYWWRVCAGLCVNMRMTIPGRHAVSGKRRTVRPCKWRDAPVSPRALPRILRLASLRGLPPLQWSPPSGVFSTRRWRATFGSTMQRPVDLDAVVIGQRRIERLQLAEHADLLRAQIDLQE